MGHQTVFFIVEVLGTIAFACSGAMVAIRHQLDLLGVVVLGVTTAVGGGMLRDLIIGVHPPSLFVNPVYAMMAFFTVLLLFVIVRFSPMTMAVIESLTYERVMNLVDAVGLGAFTVVGIDTAIAHGFAGYGFLTIFLGVITGVGGGILRDIMAGETPAVLRKHVYASASIAGAFCYVWLMRWFGTDSAMVISALLVVLIRVLARHYRWNLPRALLPGEKG